jgi:hypothetical protein
MDNPRAPIAEPAPNSRRATPNSTEDRLEPPVRRAHDIEVASMSIERRLAEAETRLAVLERRARVWRSVAVGMVGVLGLAALTGAGATKSGDVLRASEFRLEDGAGKLRGCLTMRPDGTPGLALLDNDGKLRLSLDIAADGAPGVNLHDPRGALRAALAVRPDGTPGMALFSETGAIRASMDVGTDTSSGVHVYDTNGVLRGAVALRPDGVPALGLFNARGQVAESVEVAPDSDAPSRGPR